MTLYTFYPCHEDGTSSTFETYDLVDDGEAFVRAQKVAQEHHSCSYVAIWCGARRVRTQLPADIAGAAPPRDGAAGLPGS